MKKILVTGAQGMVGNYLCPLLSQNNEVFAYSHSDLDITSLKVNTVFAEAKPDVVVHLAAFTNVDLCEQQQEKAYLVNGYALESIVDNCNKYNSHLFFISTGMIFCGKHSPYRESFTDRRQCQPVNVYGKSKLFGEELVQRAKHYSIIRTSWLFGGKQADKKFVGQMLDLSKRGSLKIINDTWGSPTYTFDLAHMITNLVSEADRKRIYHITNSGYCNRVIFAKKIFEYANIHCNISEISSSEFYQGKQHARRPDKEILTSNYSFCQMRPWEISLREYIHQELL